MTTTKKHSAIEAFLALPDEEKERQWREFDKPIDFNDTRPLTPAERKLWERAKRKRGRPKVGAGVKIISLSVEQDLLKKSDRLAKKLGVSRAFLVAQGLRHVLAEDSSHRPRKSA